MQGIRDGGSVFGEFGELLAEFEGDDTVQSCVVELRFSKRSVSPS